MVHLQQNDRFSNYLEQYGFEFIGDGSYGTVYEKRGYPWVFKIFKDDPAYMYFLKYAKANQANPHVPRIQGHTIRINDTTFAIRLEKLTPADDDVVEDIEYIAGILWLQSEQKPQDFYELIKLYPGVYTILIDMMKAGHRLDIHEGNIMSRAGVPVIIDPIV